MEMKLDPYNETVHEAYKDVVQPAAREVGVTVGGTVHMALAPLNGLIWCYSQFEKWISKKVAPRLKNVPKENIVTPELNIAGPILEAMRFSFDSELLSELYANLLAASMNKSMKDGVLPAFVEIIRQLTPDEAKLISFFAKPDEIFPLLTIKKEHKNVKNEKQGWVEVKENFSRFALDLDLECPKNISLYFENLCRLKLIEIPDNVCYAEPSIYDDLINDPEVARIKNSIEINSDLKCFFDKKVIRITEFGRQFMNICLPNFE